MSSAKGIEDSAYVQHWRSSRENFSVEPADENKLQRFSTLKDFWESCQTLVDYHGPERRCLGDLYLELSEFDKTNTASLSFLAEKPDIAVLWGLLHIDVERAISIDRENQLAVDARRIKDRSGALSGVIEILSSLLLKFERFRSVDQTSIMEHRFKRTVVDINIWFHDTLAAIYRCFANGFNGDHEDRAWKELEEENVKLHDKMWKDLEHLESVNQNLKLGNKSYLVNPPTSSEPAIRAAGFRSRSFHVEQAKLPFNNLPTRPNPNFLGRDEELRIINNFLSQNDDDTADTRTSPKCVAIDGLGGVGKTQTALYYAHSQIDSLDAVFWIPSQTEQSIQKAITEIAVGLELQGSQEGAVRENWSLLSNWLRHTTAKWLIVFDNAETSQELELWWPGGSGLVLVTARSQVPGQELGCKRIEIQCFDESTAMTLFKKLIGRDTYSEEETRAAEDFVKRLSGHALAIHQMAALIRLQQHSIAGFLKTYETKQRKLHRKQKHTRPGEYEYFLDTVWLLSFERVVKHEQACNLLGVLSFLSPDSIARDLFKRGDKFESGPALGFCTDELELPDVEEELLKLALMRKDPLADDIAVHRLVQSEFQYYINDDVRQRRFADAVKLLFDAFPQQVNGRLMHSRWDVCSKYLLHVLSLADHYKKQDEDRPKLVPSREFLPLLCSCAWYLSEIGSSQFGDLLDIAFNAYEESDPNTRSELDFAHLCNSMGVFYLDRGDFDASWKYFDMCRETREKVLDPNHEELGNIYNNLGNAAFSKNEYEKSLDYQLHGQKIRFRESSSADATARGMSRLNVGRSRWRLGECGKAKADLGEAVNLCNIAGNWYLEAHCKLLLGTFAREESEFGLAKRYYNEANDLMFKRGKLPRDYTTAAINYKLGCVECDEGEYEKAVTYLRYALEILTYINSARADKARVLYKLSVALRGSDDVTEEADKLLKEAESIRKDIEHGGYEAAKQSELAYDQLICNKWR